MIPVTKPFLPPRHEYEQYLSGIWERNWLTNMGPLSCSLEIRLMEYLGVGQLLYVTNGTLALQMAIKALDLKGEIITTPFSFVATTSSIVWEGCQPVFADIDPATLNIDANKIEAYISKNTVAILATHIYGNPCDVNAIQSIADKHGLKVIYDGAHAFGIQLNGQSIFNFGDIATCSLHATKFYHSGEGGLVITKDAGLTRKMAFMRNFGFDGPEAFAELGINGKNSEFHAALGLVNLNHIDSILKTRQKLAERYQNNLRDLRAVEPQWNLNANRNYSFYPLIFESERLLLHCMHRLAANDIHGRRYFYPALSSILTYAGKKYLPVVEDVAKRVLCLPLYHDLSLEQVDIICELLLNEQENFIETGNHAVSQASSGT